MGLKMRNRLKSFIADEAGATAIEYALIAGFISLAVISGATTIGKNLSTTFSGVASNMTATK
jgi:pilus assembly protein Flp/PilA